MPGRGSARRTEEVWARVPLRRRSQIDSACKLLYRCTIDGHDGRNGRMCGTVILRGAHRRSVGRQAARPGQLPYRAARRLLIIAPIVTFHGPSRLPRTRGPARTFLQNECNSKPIYLANPASNGKMPKKKKKREKRKCARKFALYYIPERFEDDLSKYL